MDTIGKIPEFTQDETTEVVGEKPPEEIKELPLETEAPLEELDENIQEPDIEGAIKGLQEERVKLLREVSELKGQKRQIKQDGLAVIQSQIDELKDLHPQDVEVIERVLRAKGLMTREEADKMFYEAVKDEELNKFLEKYPEYKSENDSDDANWNALQRELAYYRMPESPHKIAELLERSHRSIVRVPTDFSTQRKRQVELAGVGSGGTQKSAPTATRFSPEKRAMLKGFTQEEIQEIEKRLAT